MGYYYGSSTQQNTHGTANTNLPLVNIHAIAGLRAALRRIIAGTYTSGVNGDNQVRLQLLRTTTLLTAGTPIVAANHQPDGPAALSVITTLPTVGAFAAVSPVQLAYNQRGTATWFALVEDEAVQFIGSTAPNSELVIQSQANAATVPVTITLTHSE
jgi:hypothetical protein